MERNVSSFGETTSNLEEYYPLPITLLHLVISIFICCENIFGIVVIWMNPKLHTNTYIFICSLAVTDVGAGFAFMISKILVILERLKTFPYVDISFTYQAVSGVIYSLVYTSIVHMPIIAVERYVYIAYPFVYRRHVTFRAIVATVMTCWVVCASCVLVPIALGAYIGVGKDDQYTILFADIFALYVPSCLITGLCYARILQLARGRYQSKIGGNSSCRRNDNNNDNCITKRDKSWKHALKTVRFFLVTYVAFILFTFPNACVFAAKYFDVVFSDAIFLTTVSLSVLLSTVNFVVLTVLFKEFRSCLKRTLAWACCRT